MPLLDKPAGDPVGSHARAAEDEDALELGPLEQELEQVELLGRDDRVEAVRDRVGRRVLAADLHLRGIAERPACKLLDLGGKGRGEEERLAVGRALLDDPPDVRQEAHVEHPVDLVQDEDIDLVERAVALLEVVEKPAGCRGQDVHAAPQVRGLLAVANAPVDDGDPEVRELAYLWNASSTWSASSRVGSRIEAPHGPVAGQALDDGKRKGRRSCRCRSARSR